MNSSFHPHDEQTSKASSEKLSAELHEIETQLKRLQPAPVTLNFDQLLAGALTTDAVSPRETPSPLNWQKQRSHPRWLRTIAASWLCGAAMGACGMFFISTATSANSQVIPPSLMETAFPPAMSGDNHAQKDEGRVAAETLEDVDSVANSQPMSSREAASPGVRSSIDPLFDAILNGTALGDGSSRWRLTAGMRIRTLRLNHFRAHEQRSTANIQSSASQESTLKEPTGSSSTIPYEPPRPMTRDELLRDLLEQEKIPLL